MNGVYKVIFKLNGNLYGVKFTKVIYKLNGNL